MSGYTPISCLLWEWEPFVTLDFASRNLWLGLYTSPQSKRLVPGLFQGHVHSMAESARMPVEDAIRSLDHLLHVEMVEYDMHSRVLRLCCLPDAGEWPKNEGIMLSWWKNFRMVPTCEVRDAHVTTLRRLLEQGSLQSSKNRSGQVSQKHEDVWKETFGRVQVPPLRRHGVGRLAESDTSTRVQPGLFSLKAPILSTVCPQMPVNSDLNNINSLDTVSDGQEKAEGVGVGRGDLLLEGSVRGDVGVAGKPRLALVPPPPVVIGVDDVIETLTAVTCGKYPASLPRAARLALQQAIDATGEVVQAPNALAILSEYIASRSLGGISPEVVASPGWFAITLQEAITWKTQVETKRAELAAARAEAGI